MHPKLYGQSNRLYRRHRYQKNHGRAAHPTAVGAHESSFSPSVSRRLSTLPAFITPRLRRSLPPSATLSRTFSHGSMPTAGRPSLNSRRTEPTRNLRFPDPPPSVTAWTYRCRSPPRITKDPPDSRVRFTPFRTRDAPTGYVFTALRIGKTKEFMMYTRV